MSSAGDGCAVGVKTHVGLVGAGADAGHYKRRVTGIAKLLLAARGQHDGVVLIRFKYRLTVFAGIELRRALQNHKDVILFGVIMKRVLPDARRIAMNS